ncbi:hypothetical protein [Streptomyces rimosus]|uniref:hypothetical protein n=1 Tax=Streptomyces rimosus TaxID=1927 RepID=UPI00131D1F88|nr:hypothetical protein [Streptomyces rimosus]
MTNVLATLAARRTAARWFSITGTGPSGLSVRNPLSGRLIEYGMHITDRGRIHGTGKDKDGPTRHIAYPLNPAAGSAA